LETLTPFGGAPDFSAIPQSNSPTTDFNRIDRTYKVVGQADEEFR
jgi:hypothetical protein